MQIETLLRQASRDAVNQGSRKPFFWGGLHGYEQLQAIARELDNLGEDYPESDYLHLLKNQVERALTQNRTIAEDLKQAHQFLRRIAQCLRYPPPPPAIQGLPVYEPFSSRQVGQEIDALIQTAHPTGKIHRAQIAILSALKRRWKLYAAELLFCYDIPGLPQDNLQLESLFGRLRRHQRRISGRKSTRELLDFGQAQVLFRANDAQDLLNQIQSVSHQAYRVHRNRLTAAEASRQFRRRLHRDPRKTIRALIDDHRNRSRALVNQNVSVLLKQTHHTT